MASNDLNIINVYTYRELRKLPSTSQYPGYPIFGKFKTTVSNLIPIREGTLEFWKPIASEEYKIYLDGVSDSVTVPRTTPNKPVVNAATTKGSDVTYQPGTILTYGGKQYIATTRKAKWDNLVPPLTYGEISGLVAGAPATGLSSGGQKIPMRTSGIRLTENPYSYTDITLWILSPSESGYSFTNSNGSTVIAYFWHHPTQKKFYPVRNTESIFAQGSGALPGTIGFSYVTYVASLLGDTYSKNNPRTLGNLAIGLIPPNSPALRESIQKGLLKYMVDNQLLTPEAAIASLNTINKGGNIIQKTIGNRQGRAGNQTSQSRKPKNRNVTRPVGRNETLLTPAGTTSRQMMVQYYNVDGLAEPVDNHFEFMFPPNQINYTGIGSEWIPVDRSGAAPLVDWKGFKLLQVSFQFLLAPDRQGTFEEVAGESLISLDVEDDIAKLRKMSVAPYPVTLLGFDPMMSEQIGFPYTTGRGVDFVITELNITSLYRTIDGRINRAQCDITLQELQSDAVPLITFPKLKIPGVKLPPKDKVTKEDEAPPLDSTSKQNPAAFGQ